MQSPIERPNAVRMRLDIGLDKIEKGSKRRIILFGAHGLDIDPATRLGTVANLVALAQLELLAHTRRHGRLIPIREFRDILCERCHGSLLKEWGSLLPVIGNAFALPCQDKPQDLLPPGRSMNRPAQDLISPREIIRQHRASSTFRGAEQLRARKRGLRQAYEPTR